MLRYGVSKMAKARSFQTSDSPCVLMRDLGLSHYLPNYFCIHYPQSPEFFPLMAKIEPAAYARINPNYMHPPMKID